MIGIAIMAAGAFCVPGQAPAEPTVVVDRFIAAHNARDLDGIAAVFTRDAVIAMYAGDQVRTGESLIPAYRDHTYKAMPGLRTEVIARVVDGQVVAENERITWGGGQTAEGMTIYRVDRGCIVRMDVVPETMR